MEANLDPKVYTAPILQTLSDCTISAHSNVGSVRSENQDYMGFVAFGDYRLLVVCDGMGGHSGGYEASRMSVSAILEFVPSLIDDLGIEGALTGAIESANQKLQEFATEFPQFKGMGTTAVMCLMKEGQLWLAHVGDSRAYLIRNDEVILLTYDHTCINRLVLMGKVSYEESIDHPIGHILERSVGVEAIVMSELNDEELWLQNGDQILLCSDGFSGLALDDDILTLCKADLPLDDRVAKMIEFSLNRHADDNVTIGVLEYTEEGHPTKATPIDKREQLKSAKFDYDELSDLETADPPELMAPLPSLPPDPPPSKTSDQNTNTRSNWPLFIVGLLVVLGIGYGIYNQNKKAQAELQRIARQAELAELEAELEAELQKLIPEAEQYGLIIPQQAKEKSIRELKSQIKTQKRLATQIQGFTSQLTAYNLTPPSAPYKESQILDIETKIAEQERLKGLILPHIKSAQTAGIELIEPPYEQVSVDEFILQVQALPPQENDAQIDDEATPSDSPPPEPITPNDERPQDE